MGNLDDAAVGVRGHTDDEEPSGNAGGDVSSKAPANSFVLEDGLWTLTFDGIKKVIKDKRGMREIAVLLEHPHAEFPAAYLAALARGVCGDSKWQPSIVYEDHREEVAEIGNALKLNKDEAKEAEQKGDAARLQKLAADREMLREERGSLQGLGGRPRRQVDDFRKLYQQQQKAIARSIKKIEEVHKELARHLDAFINTDGSFRYEPDGEVVWHVSPAVALGALPSAWQSSSAPPDS